MTEAEVEAVARAIRKSMIDTNKLWMKELRNARVIGSWHSAARAAIAALDQARAKEK